MYLITKISLLGIKLLVSLNFQNAPSPQNLLFEYTPKYKFSKQDKTASRAYVARGDVRRCGVP